MDIQSNKIDQVSSPQEKSIRFPIKTHSKLVILAQKFGRHQSMLFIQMVDYFHRTGRDPLDLTDSTLKNTIVKNHDTYTSFIKMQEKILLIPMQQNVERMIKNQEQIVKFFNEQVLKANKDLLGNHAIQLEKISETQILIKSLHDNSETKKRLKAKFLHILNNYIHKREAMGAFKTRERQELVDETMHQIEIL